MSVRVFLVDDSAVILKVIGRLLETRHGFRIVGTARDGYEALRQIPRIKPDVVVLDVEMPALDGLRTLERLMRRKPRVPVIMLSAYTQAGSKATMDALALGAVDFVPKPAKADRLTGMLAELAEKINLAAKASAVVAAVPAKPARPARPVKPLRRAAVRSRAMVIGCSTGGPAALRTILPFLPADLSVPAVVVQHMPAGFTEALAEHLNQLCTIEVKHAAHGDSLRPGLVLVAPAGLVFGLRGGGGRVTAHVRPSAAPLKPGGFRPSVTDVMVDFARVYGAGSLGVLLTGMGRDGADGMAAIKRAGGRTIAQDQSTSVVYGMPKAAVEAGAADYVVPLPEIAARISALV